MDQNVKKFVAGEKLTDAIARAKRLNKQGINCIINHLGENIKIKKHATDHVFSYLEIIDKISKNFLASSISIKLSEIGFIINQSFCEVNLEKILKAASNHNVFVWIDMEEYKYMQKSLNIFRKFIKKYKNLGITIQANIRGTSEILESLIKKQARVRVVKGAYKEKQENAFQTNFQINTNYLKLMNMLFEKSDKFAIGTHDLKMIRHADTFQHRYKKNFEFQFLMGVRSKMEIDLVRAGYLVSEYVPFGKDCQGYYKRRIEEQGLHLLD